MAKEDVSSPGVESARRSVAGRSASVPRAKRRRAASLGRLLLVRILSPPSPQRVLCLAGLSAAVALLYIILTPNGVDQISNFFASDSEAALLDRYKIVALRQIQWMRTEEPGEGAEGLDKEDTWNATGRCRNTVQGATRVADDRGYVCARDTVDSTGCCADVAARTRFACEECGTAAEKNAQPAVPLLPESSTSAADAPPACCPSYEGCVSCCLHPEKKTDLLRVIDGTRGHRLRAILSARDQFELCAALCRTSSASVRHENRYKDEHKKYCFVPLEDA